MKSSPPFRLALVLGTRPEIIKLSPVIRTCDRLGVPYTVIHTGQHYSDSLDSVFFEQLELPEPDYHLGIGSDTHAKQTGGMMIGIEEVLTEIEPDVVLVQGDTNSVLAGAIVASKLPVALGHVEAGLRSFDRGMPEEINRVLADHVADHLFAPTDQSRDLLLEEGLPLERISVTGNTIVDAVHQNREIASVKSTILRDLDLDANEYALMTAHRAENVDSEDRFADILDGASRVGRALGIDVIYPIHPRSETALREFDLEVPGEIRLIDPQDYLDFLKLQRDASVILTDSGGIQEEACILNVPCVTLRDNTERPETIAVGANRLVGTAPNDILEGAQNAVGSSNQWPNPFGNGDAAERIIQELSPGAATEVPV